MNSIFDVLEKRKEELDMQGVTARKMTPDELDFVLAKKYIDDLPSQYNSLINDNSFFSRKFKFSKNYFIELEKYIFNTRIVLEIIGNESKAVQKVTYYAYNKNTAYLREILGGKN